MARNPSSRPHLSLGLQLALALVVLGLGCAVFSAWLSHQILTENHLRDARERAAGWPAALQALLAETARQPEESGTLNRAVAEFHRRTGADAVVVAGEEGLKILALSRPTGGMNQAAQLIRDALSEPIGAPRQTADGDGRTLVYIKVTASALPGLPAEARVILYSDESAALAKVRELARLHGLGAGLAMLLAIMLVIAVVSPSMLRLARLARPLPLIADDKLAEARAQIARVRPSRLLRDEVDLMRDNLLRVVEQLDRLQGAEQSSEAKSRFLATMSHEIRTPMNGILGLTELLQQSSLDDDQERMARMIRESGESLMTIINDILDYAKLEAGGMEPEQIPFSPVTLAEAAAETVTASAFGKGLRLVVLTDPRLPLSVSGDPAKTRQILLNLTSNAIKFTESGRVLIRAEELSRGDDDLVIRYSVTDTGLGIAEDAIDKLFEGFSQLDSSTTRRFGGTGLGLAICRSLVELMGGEMGVESEVGKGSRFWFDLPYTMDSVTETVSGIALHDVRVRVAGDDAEEVAGWTATLRELGASLIEQTRTRAAGGRFVEVIAHHEAERSGALVNGYDDSGKLKVSRRLGRPVRRLDLIDAVRAAARLDSALPARRRRRELESGSFGHHVLVAEDQAVNRELLQQQLGHLGCTVEMAENGAAALRALDAARFDLLLTDLHMPELDGHELIRRVRAHRDPEVRKMPIAIISASGGDQHSEELRTMGVTLRLLKPLRLVDTQRLLSTIRPRPPAPDAQSGAPLIDKRLLYSVIGDHPRMVSRFARRFIELNGSQIDALGAAVAQGEADQVIEIAHRIRGSANSLGATRLGDALAVLEKNYRPETAGALFEQARELYEATTAELDRLATGADSPDAGPGG